MFVVLNRSFGLIFVQNHSKFFDKFLYLFNYIYLLATTVRGKSVAYKEEIICSGNTNFVRFVKITLLHIVFTKCISKLNYLSIKPKLSCLGKCMET